MIINKDFYTPIQDDSKILLCVFRDENLLLDHFINYYSNIGITHFILLNNDSQDESFQYLMNSKENIMLLSTNLSYKEANFGAEWINYLLDKYCRDKWCIVVDVDELIYIDNINNLIYSMEKNNSNICNFLLLDMYSNTNRDYQKGESFLNHSYYFDKYNNYYNINTKGTIGHGIWGGVRNRLLNSNVCIIKRSLFYYNFYHNYKLSCGYHWLTTKENHLLECKHYNDINIHNELNFVLHFKFIKPYFKDFIETRINNNQDWDNSSEYKLYRSLDTNNMYNDEFSVSLVSKEDLLNIFNELT